MKHREINVIDREVIINGISHPVMILTKEFEQGQENDAYSALFVEALQYLISIQGDTFVYSKVSIRGNLMSIRVGRY